MKTQVLSIEQMQHLIELGVDTSKTKMAWYAIYETLPNWYNELRIRDDVFDRNYPSVPTFTLQDMLEMMPYDIKVPNNPEVEGRFYRFQLRKLLMPNYEIRYIDWEDTIFISICNEDLLTCTYEALCWLVENKYIGGKK